jgi:hypothetical protein
VISISRAREDSLVSRVEALEALVTKLRDSDIAPLACYGAETLRGNSLRCMENLRILIVFFSGPFLYDQQLYFDSRFRLYIIHGTDTIMTQYDTGRTEIPFGRFDVCIWVSPFLVQDSPIEGTPHQCPSCGIFAAPLN